NHTRRRHRRRRRHPLVMKPVLSREQIRAFDKKAIESCSVPSLVLMENAARNATDILEREMLGGTARGKRVVVLCGTGNNGGDGFAIARHLLTRGAHVTLRLSGPNGKLSADAKANADAWRGLGGAIALMSNDFDCDVIV